MHQYRVEGVTVYTFLREKKPIISVYFTTRDIFFRLYNRPYCALKYLPIEIYKQRSKFDGMLNYSSASL